MDCISQYEERQKQQQVLLHLAIRENSLRKRSAVRSFTLAQHTFWQAKQSHIFAVDALVSVTSDSIARLHHFIF
ncbi:hypothetical protein T07_14404 [Trichinella nelsoni]|uniref:Uncharacterized protein n=1 Tax=Trichinella nelsoni TaxID=6336 RepID=A0A0V0S5P3_9BILA|nr:hypothetical protein T07_14404 [Trichinella nelsoni]